MYSRLKCEESFTRSKTDPIARQKYDATAEADKIVVDRVAEVANKQGVPHAQISLAWLLHKDGVVSPSIGATKIAHLESAVEAMDVHLEPEDIDYLEALYVPHPLVGLIPYGGQLLSARK